MYLINYIFEHRNQVVNFFWFFFGQMNVIFLKVVYSNMASYIPVKAFSFSNPPRLGSNFPLDVKFNKLILLTFERIFCLIIN